MNYSEETDESLFILLKEDNEKAFNVLYNRYWDRLLEIAFYKLRSQAEAEEAVQQVFLELWKNRLKTELKYSFRTYISAALRYTVYALVAQQRNLSQVSIESLETDAFVDDSTREWLSFSDVREKLELVLQQLPEKSELIFKMSRNKGMSVKEIAIELNISPKTVEAHITRVIKVIKASIDQIWIL